MSKTRTIDAKTARVLETCVLAILTLSRATTRRQSTKKINNGHCKETMEKGLESGTSCSSRLGSKGGSEGVAGAEKFCFSSIGSRGRFGLYSAIFCKVKITTTL